MSRFERLLLGAASLALLVAGCGRATTPSGSQEIDGDAYIAALKPFLPPPRPPSAENRAVVFIVPLDGRALPLDMQIEIVAAFARDYDVRFVDDASAAIDEHAANEPPQEGGLLIGIGPVTTDAPHSTRVEVYWNHDLVEGHLVTLSFGNGQWRVTSDEPVTPEVLSRRA